MEIKLSKEEVFSIFLKAFNGVIELKKMDDSGVILDVDLTTFSQIPVTTGTIVKNVNALTAPVQKTSQRTLEEIKPETIMLDGEVKQRLVTVKPKRSEAETQRLLNEAEQLNRAQNEKEKFLRMASAGEERPLTRLG